MSLPCRYGHFSPFLTIFILFHLFIYFIFFVNKVLQNHGSFTNPVKPLGFCKNQKKTCENHGWFVKTLQLPHASYFASLVLVY